MFAFCVFVRQCLLRFSCVGVQFFASATAVVSVATGLVSGESDKELRRAEEERKSTSEDRKRERGMGECHYSRLCVPVGALGVTEGEEKGRRLDVAGSNTLCSLHHPLLLSSSFDGLPPLCLPPLSPSSLLSSPLPLPAVCPPSRAVLPRTPLCIFPHSFPPSAFPSLSLPSIFPLPCVCVCSVLHSHVSPFPPGRVMVLCAYVCVRACGVACAECILCVEEREEEETKRDRERDRIGGWARLLPLTCACPVCCRDTCVRLVH